MVGSNHTITMEPSMVGSNQTITMESIPHNHQQNLEVFYDVWEIEYSDLAGKAAKGHPVIICIKFFYLHLAF